MSGRLIKNTIIQSLGEVGIKILGFSRDLLIAALFGVSAKIDAFFVALNVPSIFVSILGTAFTTAFIPVYFRYRENKTEEERYVFLANITSCVAVVFVLLGLLVFILAPVMIRILAPGFSVELSHFATGLVRYFSLLTVLTGLGVFLKAPAQCESRFGWAVLSDLVFNGVILIASLLLCPTLGIYGLVYAYLIGGTASLIIISFRYFKDKGRLSYINLSEPGLKEVFRLSIPLYLGLITTNISIIIDRAMASGLPSGSISALTFADKIRWFPVTIFATALATVLFPNLSRLVTIGQREEIIKLIDRVVKIILVGCTYVVNMTILLALPITVVLFERGNFERTASIITSEAVLFYGLSIPGLAIGMMLLRVYHAHKDTKTPVIISIISVGANIILNLILIGPMAHKGIALATAIANWLWSLMLWFFLRRHQIKVFRISYGNIWFLAKLAIINFLVYLTGLGLLNLCQNLREVIILLVVASAGVLIGGFLLWVSSLYKELGFEELVKIFKNKTNRGIKQ